MANSMEKVSHGTNGKGSVASGAVGYMGGGCGWAGGDAGAERQRKHRIGYGALAWNERQKERSGTFTRGARYRVRFLRQCPWP